jgi:hypothetical protein
MNQTDHSIGDVMKTRRKPVVRTAIERALAARDCMEMDVAERLLGRLEAPRRLKARRSDRTRNARRGK